MSALAPERYMCSDCGEFQQGAPDCAFCGGLLHLRFRYWLWEVVTLRMLFRRG